MTLDQQYSALVESLRLVAAPADLQVCILPDFVSVTDEVSTTFGDAFLLLPQLECAGRVSARASAAVKELDSWFAGMPTDGSIAPAESLAAHDFWRSARELAATALEGLGEDVKPPDLTHINWVET